MLSLLNWRQWLLAALVLMAVAAWVPLITFAATLVWGLGLGAGLLAFAEAVSDKPTGGKK